MPKLSLAIIVKNEEPNLPRFLAAAAGLADEIVAVDSGSTDRTVELLLAAGARVEQREFSGFADQKNYAGSLATGDFVLYLDADEVPDAQLAAALLEVKSGARPGRLFEINRKPYFFGKFLTHGGFFPEYRTRLAALGQASWRGQVHESLIGRESPARLPGVLLHYSYETVGDYLTRLERYSRLAAAQMKARGKKAGPFSVFGHSAWAFFSRFVLRAGFLDGYQGYLAARLESVYTMAKYARLMELNRGVEDGE